MYKVYVAGIAQAIPLVPGKDVLAIDCLADAVVEAERQFERAWESVSGNNCSITRADWLREGGGSKQLTNTLRANRIRRVLQASYVDFGTQPEQLKNVLADAMHWAQINNHSFDMILDDARECFLSEIGVGGE